MLLQAVFSLFLSFQSASLHMLSITIPTMLINFFSSVIIKHASACVLIAVCQVFAFEGFNNFSIGFRKEVLICLSHLK